MAEGLKTDLAQELSGHMDRSGRILVTGASGRTGRTLVELLVDRGVPVRAMVRNRARAPRLERRGAEVVVGDLDDPKTLDAAFAGAQKVYFVTWDGPTAARHGRNVIAAARRSGRPHVVMHSAWGPPQSRIIKQAEEVEAALEASGLPWTILKPTFFMQNTLMAAGAVSSDGVIPWPLEDGKIGMIDLRDVAEVAASVLTGTGHEGRSYVLTGPASISFHDVANALSQALARPVTYANVPAEAARVSMLDAGLLEWIVDGWMELMAGFAENWGDRVTDAVPTLAGRPGRSYERFFRDHAPVFAGQTPPGT